MGDKRISRRKHFEQVEKTLGRQPKELQCPELQEGAEYLWFLYVDLHNATDGNISYQEMQAYSYFNGDLTPFETQVIRTLNQIHQRTK